MPDDGGGALTGEAGASGPALVRTMRSVLKAWAGGARPRRLRLALLIAGLPAALIGLVLGSGLVGARDDLGLYALIHADAEARRGAALRPPLRDAHPVVAPAPAQAATSHRVAAAGERAPSAALRGGERSVCVRLCDGYHFPVGAVARAADLPAHEAACRSSCPGAPVRLFTLKAGQDDVGAAVSRSMSRPTAYRDLPMAYAYQRRLDRTCACAGAPPRDTRVALFKDPTLRHGDTIVLESGPRVFAGAGQGPHHARDFQPFRTAAALSPAARRRIDDLMGISQREAAEHAFRARMRVVAAPVPRADVPPIRFVALAPQPARPAGFQALN